MKRFVFVLALLVVWQVAQPAHGKGRGGHSSGQSAGGMTATGGAGSARTMRGGGTGAYRIGPPVAMDPNRKINEQDCTAPIDPFAGNLRCR